MLSVRAATFVGERKTTDPVATPSRETTVMVVDMASVTVPTVKSMPEYRSLIRRMTSGSLTCYFFPAGPASQSNACASAHRMPDDCVMPNSNS